MMGASAQLKEQHRNFCLEYFKNGGNATAAAIKAGFAARSARQTASRLLTRNDIQAYLRELEAKTNKDRVADLQECLEAVTTIIRDEKSSTSDRLKALDMRLRTLSAYETNIKLSNDTINITIDEQ